MTTSDEQLPPADEDRRSSEGLGLVPKRNAVAWDLALLAQTLEFSDSVRTQCQRGHDEIERLLAELDAKDARIAIIEGARQREAELRSYRR